MLKLSSVKADLVREEQGEYVDYPRWPGVSFGVRSLETPSYKLARQILLQKFARKYKGQPAPDRVVTTEFGKLYAQHILFGWNGVDEEYTSDLAMERLTDPAYRKLVEAVEWCAGHVGDSEEEFVEGAVGNSGRPSVTS